MFDEQPVGSLSAGPIMLHANQDPAAVQAFTVKREFEITAG
jgi:hypothetical protein